MSAKGLNVAVAQLLGLTRRRWSLHITNIEPLNDLGVGGGGDADRCLGFSFRR